MASAVARIWAAPSKMSAPRYGFHEPRQVPRAYWNRPQKPVGLTAVAEPPDSTSMSRYRPRAATPCALAAAWMSGHQAPWPPAPPAAGGATLGWGAGVCCAWRAARRATRLGAGQQAPALRQLGADAAQLGAASLHEALRGALVGGQQRAAMLQPGLRGEYDAHHFAVAAADLARQRELVHELLEVGRREQRVHGAQVAVLVERHGALQQLLPGHTELQGGESTQAPVPADLGAHRAERARGPGVLLHRGVDVAIQARDLGAELPRPRALGRPACGTGRTSRGEGHQGHRDQQQGHRRKERAFTHAQSASSRASRQQCGAIGMRAPGPARGCGARPGGSLRAPGAVARPYQSPARRSRWRDAERSKARRCSAGLAGAGRRAPQPYRKRARSAVAACSSSSAEGGAQAPS